MKITCLLENSQEKTHCIAEHGLSLYTETQSHKLLLDFGQTHAMLDNAQILGIDLRAVDIAFLSHGHYDHSGSLLAFAEQNPRAKIYMQKNAVEPHFHGERYIGIDTKIALLPQVHLLDGNAVIDDELSVFAGISGRRCYPQGNRELEVFRNHMRIEDDFSHEQCLVITQADKHYLLSGCAHNGILNILGHFHTIYGGCPDAVITGFHMMKNAEYTAEEWRIIEETAHELKMIPTKFYSGHCTGLTAFARMKDIMGDQLEALHSGESIEV